jgi:branched-chain amino acid transport system permease protein
VGSPSVNPARSPFGRSAVGPAIAVVVLAVLPWIVPSFVVFDLIYVAAYAVGILGLVILTGMNGQISLGHGAFMAVGGYTVAILAHAAGLPYWLSVPIAALASGLLGIVVGLIALRLAGIYLALATYSLAIATPSFLKHYKDVTGGFAGISLESVTPPPWSPLGPQHWLYYIAWCVAAAAFLASAWVVRGRFGRALRALRDNPIAAVSFGINPYIYKTLAFCWSAVLAGVAGALFAVATAYVSPDTFPLQLSITLLIGAVLGGIWTFWGALIGAIIVEFLPLVAQQINNGAPSVVYGVALIVVMLFVPDGVAGGVRRLASRVLRGNAPASAAFESSASAASIPVNQPSRE